LQWSDWRVPKQVNALLSRSANQRDEIAEKSAAQDQNSCGGVTGRNIASRRMFDYLPSFLFLSVLLLSSHDLRRIQGMWALRAAALSWRWFLQEGRSRSLWYLFFKYWIYYTFLLYLEHHVDTCAVYEMNEEMFGLFI